MHHDDKMLSSSDSRPVAFMLCMLMTLACVAGCGGKENMVVVRGKVTLDGKLVTEGRVRFEPALGTQGRVSIAPINEAGEYEAHHKGGVPIGTHHVSIVAYALEGIGPALDGNHPSIDMANPQAAMQARQKKLPIPVYEVQGLPQFLPPRFNAESELTIEVTGEDDPQTVDFELTSEDA